MKAKVLLITPDNPASVRFQMLTAGVTQPLGLGYLASSLRQHGFEPFVIDNTIEELSPEIFSSRFRAIDPDIVGITALTYAVNNALALARLVKEIKPGVKVIFGGSHANALPREMLKDPAVDIVVKGEGEVTIVEVVRALTCGDGLKGVAGVVYKENDGIFENAPRSLIENIDTIPFPAFDLLPMAKYTLPSSRRLTASRIGSIITTRGCPFSCSFCSKVIFQNTVRMRSPLNVIEEIELLVKKFKIGELMIWDDNFNLNPKRAMEICELMIKRNFNVTWTCSNRANLFSEEMCQIFYDSGCRVVNFGIESGSKRIREGIKKQLAREEIYKAIRLCRKYKLRVSCSFIFGLPGETYESACETLKFAKELDPDYGIFCAFVPMPGSELFETMEKRGLIDVGRERWDEYVTLLSAKPPVISMGNLSREDLVVFQKRVFREFYFRPQYIINALRRIRGLEHFKATCRGLNAIVRHQLANIS